MTKNAKTVIEAEIVAPVTDMVGEPIAPTAEDEAAYDGSQSVTDVLTAEELNTLEQAEAQIEAAQSSVPDTPAPAPVVEDEEEDEDDVAALFFANVVAGVEASETAQMTADVDTAFTTRADFERAKDPANTNIHKTLDKCGKALASPLIAACMVAAEINPNFLNAGTATSRYNVYGIDKVRDLLTAVATGRAKNAINAAIVASMFKFAKAGIAFTGRYATGAVSDKVDVGDKQAAALLVRHDASASTAPTQMSSTMNALMTIGAVKNTGTAKFPVYQFTGAPIVGRLKEIFDR